MFLFTVILNFHSASSSVIVASFSLGNSPSKWASFSPIPCRIVEMSNLHSKRFLIWSCQILKGRASQHMPQKRIHERKIWRLCKLVKQAIPIEWFLREMHLFHTKQIFYGFFYRVTPPHCLHHVGPVEYMTRVKWLIALEQELDYLTRCVPSKCIQLWQRPPPVFGNKICRIILNDQTIHLQIVYTWARQNMRWGHTQTILMIACWIQRTA